MIFDILYEIDLLKITVLGWFWKIPFISRRWCWMDAVAWVLGETKVVGRADPTCFFCGACHTDSELNCYFKSVVDDQ